MLKFWKIWRARRRAVAAARAILHRPDYSSRVTPRQVQDLLALRARFYKEKMGSWPERLNLYLLAAELPPGARVVEIGAWVGVGTSYLAGGLRSGAGGRIYAVDTFQGTTLDSQIKRGWKKTVERMGGSTLKAFQENIRAFQLEELVTPIVASSQEAARQWPGDPVQLLYIDGDHAYEAVKIDYAQWSGYVPPGGWIVFHDYNDRHPGVRQLVDEVMAGDLAGHEPRLVDSLLMIRK